MSKQQDIFEKRLIFIIRKDWELDCKRQTYIFWGVTPTVCSSFILNDNPIHNIPND